jgi:hypothetical protein
LDTLNGGCQRAFFLMAFRYPTAATTFQLSTCAVNWMQRLAKNGLRVLLLLVITSGCKGQVERKLICTLTQQSENPPRARCHVALKDLTPFAWDKLYFFGAWTSAATMADATGLP